MAVTGFGALNSSASRGALSRVRQHIEALLASERFLTQRVAGTAFAIRIASAGIVFVTQILLARWMGSYQFGSYVYVWTWLLMAGDIVHLGMPLTAQRFIPEYTETKAFDFLRGYLSGSRWLSFAAGAAFAMLGGVVVAADGDAISKGIWVREGFKLTAAESSIKAPRFMTFGPEGALFVSVPRDASSFDPGSAPALRSCVSLFNWELSNETARR